MRAALTIAARDLRAAFESPLAYVLIAVFLVMSGGVFALFLLKFASLSDTLRAVSAAQGDASMLSRLSLDRAVVSPTLRVVSALLIGLVPLLTMRALAEERRQGTMELLLTSPVSPWSIVVGKFLGAYGIACAAILLTVGYPLTLAAVAAPDLGPLVTGYLGLFLVAAVLTALGILASALTESTIVAAFLGFALVLGSVLCGVIGGVMTSNAGIVVAWLSPLVHYDALAEGIVDTADVAYYAIVTVAALFLGLRVVDAQRWR